MWIVGVIVGIILIALLCVFGWWCERQEDKEWDRIHKTNSAMLNSIKWDAEKGQYIKE